MSYQEWSETKKWIMGIAAAVIAAVIIGLGGKFFSNGNTDPSVLPHIDIGYIFADDTSRFSSGITIDNAGLGPAIIKKLEILWREDGTWKPLGNWNELSSKLKIDPLNTSYISFKKDNALSPGRNLLLYAVSFNTEPSRKLADNIENIQIRIEYESLVGDEKVATLH